jgi:hypothetical protein
MNREQRRKKGRAEQIQPPRPNEDTLKRPTDDPEAARTKSSAHGKVTADKWNQ